MMLRQDLEIVIQKKKLDEVFNWFHDHFITCDRADYLARTPLIAFQGPTGSGKSTVLRWIANEIGVPVKEFTETTDLTSINYDLNSRLAFEDIHRGHVTLDEKKAKKFEQFIISNIRYKPLLSCLNNNLNGSKSAGGVIIHIETPLSFTRNQKLTTNTLCRLLTIVKELSKRTPRRVAIVFETIEGDSNETLILSGKMKSMLGFQIFKFNPIIKANLKKLIDQFISKLDEPVHLDKQTVDQLAEDCNGDMTACIKTLQLICNKSNNQYDAIPSNGMIRMYSGTVGDSGYSTLNNGVDFTQTIHRNSCPPNKRQKVTHMKGRKLVLDVNLMRDITQSSSFFHVLGKIFYQKRYYPPINGFEHRQVNYLKSHHMLERPFELVNDTETIINMVDVQPSHLITWLHQHYTRFCSYTNILKAENFIENLSDIDLISTSSAQSSQFYEFHNITDQLQTRIAIDSTTFSLYHNMIGETKPSHKKVEVGPGKQRIIKSSVEIISNPIDKRELYSFSKPLLFDVNRLSDEYAKLINICRERSDIISSSIDLIEYLPYLRLIRRNKQNIRPDLKAKYYKENYGSHEDNFPIIDGYLLDSLEILDEFSEIGLNQDIIEKRIEKLNSIIENLESTCD